MPTVETPSAATESAWVRAMRVLNALAGADRSLSRAEVAARSGMTAASTHALLKTLARDGLVQVEVATDRYQPGPAVQHLEALMAQNHSLMARVQPVLARLVEETGETATYNVLSLDALGVTPVAKIYGRAALQYELPLGQPRRLVAGVGAKTVLAHLADDALELALSKQLSPRAATARRRLLAELAEIRAAGYAVTRGEQLEGAVGIAAPVFGAGGRVVGSLLLTVPELRFGAVPLKKVIKALLGQAAALSHRFGADPARARRR